MEHGYNPRAELVNDDPECVRRVCQALGYAWGRNDQGFRTEDGGEADSWAFAHYYLTVAAITTLRDAWQRWLPTSRMNPAQRHALIGLCERYGVEFTESAFTRGGLGLPSSSVCGQVGPLFLGCDHNGRICT